MINLLSSVSNVGLNLMNALSILDICEFGEMMQLLGSLMYLYNNGDDNVCLTALLLEPMTTDV